MFCATKYFFSIIIFKKVVFLIKKKGKNKENSRHCGKFLTFRRQSIGYQAFHYWRLNHKIICFEKKGTENSGLGRKIKLAFFLPLD